MERHRCKLCNRKFANGRALGGHMRSHMMNLPILPKPPPPRPSDETESSAEEVEEQSPSSSSSSSDSEEDIEEEEDEEMIGKGLLVHKLRENPKKSMKLADLDHQPEAAGSSSVTLQDRESETESCRNPTRVRSKRLCRSRKKFDHDYGCNSNHNHDRRVVVAARAASSDYNNEAEPGSSISEVTSEEDVAFCLMMLSRDKWISSNCHGRDFGANVNDDIGTVSNYHHNPPPSQFSKKSRGGGGGGGNGGGRYKCETCNKVFKSYQALGGHRASHKKTRVAAQARQAFFHDDAQDKDKNEMDFSKSDKSVVEEKKIHECPVCLRVFGSGQALGGHKRSHVIAGSSGIDDHNKNQMTIVAHQSSMDIDQNNTSNVNLFIDLNLPAPVEDDDEEISQIALSAVSDAHFS